MSWAKIDDQLHSNEKALGCSLAARGLWLMCLSWVADRETDGAIPRSVARLHGGEQWVNLAAELVECGLWEEREAGWAFHDYLAYNPSRADLEKERQGAAERKARWKKRQHPTEGTASPQQENADGTPTERCSERRGNSVRTLAPVPDPVPLEPIPTTLVRNGTQCAGAGPAEGRETTSRPTRRDTPPEQPAERAPTPPGTRPRPQASQPTATREDYAPPGKASPPPKSGRGPTLRDARPETRRDRETFIAATLAQADADPERRHWRAALADTLAHAAPREPDRYQASILAAWLGGESLPPKPAAAPRAVTMQDMEAFYGLAPGEQMTSGPFPSALAAEAERKKIERAAELQALADRARAADPRPVHTPEANP